MFVRASLRLKQHNLYTHINASTSTLPPSLSPSMADTFENQMRLRGSPRFQTGHASDMHAPEWVGKYMEFLYRYHYVSLDLENAIDLGCLTQINTAMSEKRLPVAGVSGRVTQRDLPALICSGRTNPHHPRVKCPIN